MVFRAKTQGPLRICCAAARRFQITQINKILMFPKINPTETNAWQQLKKHYEEMKNVSMKKMFQDDGDRFPKFSTNIDDIVFDYSKNRINEATMGLLLKLAEECRVKEAIEAMFNGDKINETENRSVLHVALRNF